MSLHEASNMSGLRAQNPEQNDAPEDDPSFVLAKAASSDSSPADEVQMRVRDWSEQPDPPDNVPMTDIQDVLEPMQKLNVSDMVQNRGFNNRSGSLYWDNGLDQFAGKPRFGITLLPRPQYVNAKNVKYLNMHSHQLHKYKGICKLEVLRGMNLAGGNHPAGEAVSVPTVTRQREMPMLGAVGV
mgnify:FL=1